MNIFLKAGDKDVTELYNRLRIGIIQSVDTNKATVTVQWLDKSGNRIEVPIAMPFCERGWGIYTMPDRYSLVLCDVRPYEMPVILAYLPPNFMNDDKAWSNFKTISSFPSGFDKGEIVIRNLIGKAKCKLCKKVSTLDEWAATYSYNNINDRIRMETCPKCYKPAVEMTADGTITAVNKIQLGILMYLQRSGRLSIQVADGLSETDGDTFESGSLIKIEFDENSNLKIEGIDGLTMSSVNVTETVKENIDVTSKDSKETTEHKLIESGNIELGDTSAITIGQAEKIITVMNRLITELNSHVHTGNLGSPTSPPTVPFTEPQQSEIETIKTKAS